MNPDSEAIAEREGRRSREQAELGFQSAAERFDGDDEGDGERDGHASGSDGFDASDGFDT